MRMLVDIWRKPTARVPPALRRPQPPQYQRARAGGHLDYHQRLVLPCRLAEPHRCLRRLPRAVSEVIRVFDQIRPKFQAAARVPKNY